MILTETHLRKLIKEVLSEQRIYDSYIGKDGREYSIVQKFEYKGYKVVVGMIFKTDGSHHYSYRINMKNRSAFTSYEPYKTEEEAESKAKKTIDGFAK